MASPARQRILDAALGLIRERGIGRVTTKEIALAAGAAEGSLFKNFGDKMGLLTELLSYELPESRAWRALVAEAPPGQGDLVTALVLFMERAIDFYAAALPSSPGPLPTGSCCAGTRSSTAIAAPGRSWPSRPLPVICADGSSQASSTGQPILMRWPSRCAAVP